MEEGESPAAALVREVSEEAGPHVMIRPVGLVHSYLYRFDSAIPAMLSIDYVATYLGGDVVPGSDMAMSDIRWAGIDEIERGEVGLVTPTQPWLFRRALAVHTLLKNEQVDLEPWQTTNPHHGAPSRRPSWPSYSPTSSIRRERQHRWVTWRGGPYCNGTIGWRCESSTGTAVES